MRKAILLLSAILLSGIALGQLPQCDLQLEIVPFLPRPYVMDSGDVSPDLYLKITNLGPDDLDTTDFIYLSGNFKAIDTGTQGKKYLEPGDDLIIYWGKVVHNLSVPGTPIIYRICTHLSFSDTTNYFFQDPDADNDSICIDFSLRGRAPDETGISTLTAASFSIYPNPASGSINIQFRETASGPLVISIYDMQGRLLYRREDTPTGQNNTSIDIEALHPGAYLLEIRDTGGAAHRQKFLKY